MIKVWTLLIVAACAAVGVVAGHDATVETTMPDPREDALDAYVDAVNEGDEPLALAAWAIPTIGIQAIAEDIAERREQLTAELVDGGAHIEYTGPGPSSWTGYMCRPVILPGDELLCGQIAQLDARNRDGETRTYLFRISARERDGLWLGMAPEGWELVDVFPSDNIPGYYDGLFRELVPF